MNCEGKMSFRDLIFPNNPQQIRITQGRSVREQRSLNGDDFVFVYGRGARRISGEGEFYGEDCAEQYQRLKRLFEKGGAGILYVPSRRPVTAHLEELQMIAEDIGRLVRYRFVFVECTDKEGCGAGRLIADGTKCLWDYSYIYGTDINALTELNPDISRPDIPVSAGRSVRLC